MITAGSITTETLSAALLGLEDFSLRLMLADFITRDGVMGGRLGFVLAIKKCLA
jgi:hypothetical protein